MAEGQPWEQLPGESARAFRAFCAYRDLGPERSLDAVAAALVPPSRRPRKPPGRINKWSSDHRWAERARTFDAFADSERVRASLKAQADAAGLTVARTLRERYDHIERMKALAGQLIAQGAALTALPGADHRVDGEDGGPAVAQAAHARAIEAGARLLARGHAMMMGLFEASLRAAVPVADERAVQEQPPTAEQARAQALAQLETAATGLAVAAGNGDPAALAGLLRVLEYQARLLGLHAPPAQQPAAQGFPVPRYISVVPSDEPDRDDRIDPRPGSDDDPGGGRAP